MPKYTSSKLNLHYEVFGDGPPLLLLHGFGQHGGAWYESAEKLSPFFRVIVPDMRGMGRSEETAPGFSCADMALDMVALLDHLSIPQVHFAGWSLGGMVAIEFALAHPDRLLSLALHSTLGEGVGGAWGRNWIDMRRKIIVSGDRELDFQTRMIGFLSPEFLDEQPERVEEFKRRDLNNKYPGTETGVAGLVVASRQFDARERVHAISTPTLITVGSADRTTRPAASHFLHQRIKGSELFIFHNAGHLPAFQVLDEFVSISIGFTIKHGARH